MPYFISLYLASVDPRHLVVASVELKKTRHCLLASTLGGNADKSDLLIPFKLDFTQD